MTFTTRPDIAGTFGVATSTHWIASAVGMKLLEAGGTAADAAVGMGFTLNVVEPHLNGPLGDVPILVRAPGAEAPTVICGQGVTPAGATIAHYRGEGLDLIPGAGLLAAVVPGAFDAWMLLLRDHGRLSLREVMAPAIHYAEAGHPILPVVAATMAEMGEFFREEWPSSAAVWNPPAPGGLFRNPDLAAFWRRLVDEAEAAQGREAQIEAARKAFYEGFVAEAIDAHIRDACVMDSTGERRKGVLTDQDMAAWRASVEAPVSGAHAGWTVWKAGPWSQGPMLLQALAMLEDDALGDLDPSGADFVHLVTETLKLAFADRETYYGDPDFSDIPLETLLSTAYARARRAMVGETASREQRPGEIDGFTALAEAMIARAARPVVKNDLMIGTGEPTMAHLAPSSGDTCHLDVIDQWGGVVSATPSGGWFQSNPVVPGLGVPLGSRAQMCWLDEGLPSSLAPGRRPRTTLTPSLAAGPDGEFLSFGTPGGDQQDQWQLIFFLRVVHHRMSLQQAIDAPLFHTGHAQASFYPREARPGHLMIEPAFGPEALDDLRGRGHDLEVSEPWSIGRLTAARRLNDGRLSAAATPRLMQAYAVGR